jgi:hypothetical protein
MASYTTSLRLVQPSDGDVNWGTTVNNGLTALVDTAVAGTATITMTAANYTLTSANGATDEARAMFLSLTGTPGASYQVICPAVSKLYFVTNSTGFAQTLKTPSGSGISIPNGRSMMLRCNGTDVVDAVTNFSSLAIGNAAFALSGGFNVTFTTTGTTTLTLPTTGTLASLAGTETFTNKRITSRVSSTASITSPLAWNSNNFDQYAATAQAGALTFNADAGTPTDGQKIIFRIKDNGTARALTWTTGTSNSFRAVGVTLPTTTVINKTVYVGCIYNAADSRWDAVAVAQEA